jgi:tRNA G18 (ribose-2'-O)-methylase SpoU
MDRLTKGKTHKGIVMKCERKFFIDLKTFQDLKRSLKKENGNLVCLVEGVQGNHNLAVLIRTCIYMGSDALIFNRKYRPHMNTQLARVSGGASELYKFYSVRFIKNFLTKARQDGWVVIALDSDQIWLDDDEQEIEEKSTSTSSSSDSDDENSKEHQVKKVTLNNLPEFESTKNIIVMMTSKSDSHKHSIDYLVTVPPLGDESYVDKFPYTLIKNLNTGVTAGMVLSHLRTTKGNNNK